MTRFSRTVFQVLDPMCRWATRRSVRILMYHRFGTHTGPKALGVEAFESHIRFLKRYFLPCSLAELTDRLRNGRALPSNLVVLTVDDGYSDFLRFAYPILRRYEVPATLYVTSRFADQDMWMWFDALRYALHRAPAGSYRIEAAGRHDLVLSDVATREAAWHTLADAALMLDPADRQRTLARLRANLGVHIPGRPSDEFSAMSWEEIRSLDPGLIEVGGHTCTHPVLSKCSDSELEEEIVASKAVIEQRIGRPVVSFAYPNGQIADYDDRVIRVVQRAGYQSALVAHGSFVRPGANLLALERVGPPDDESEFRTFINGYSDVADRARLRLRAASFA